MKKPLIFILTILAIFSLSSCGKNMTSIERVENITGYDLPNDMEELYHFQDDVFVGCAGQYSVYSLDKEPSCFTDKEISSPIADADIEGMMYYFETYDIPEEHYPDFEQEYTYITGKENTFIMYFPNEKKLKIWMWGH